MNGYLTVAEADLRAERKRLIIEKVREKFGEEVPSEVAEQVKTRNVGSAGSIVKFKTLKQGYCIGTIKTYQIVLV